MATGISNQQRYGLVQVATYGNLGVVPSVTARSLYARRLVVAVPVDLWSKVRHVQLTAAGWALLSADERAQAVSKAYDDATRWATLVAEKFRDSPTQDGTL